MTKQVEAEEVRSASTKSANYLKDRETAKQREFISLALGRFKEASDHESKMRADSLDDFEFSIGEQWPGDIKTQRIADGRPCLTMDHLDQSIKIVTNNQRQQRQAIQINPAGSGATRKVAEILQGIFRHIETNNDAEICYDTTFDHMSRGGFGWIEVGSEYVPGDTFDQEITIDYVENPFTVYDDPAATGKLRQNARFRFVIFEMPWPEYKREYPQSRAASATLSDLTSIGDKASGWATKEAIRIARYYHVENETYEICQLEDGSIKKKSEVGKKDVVAKTREVTKKKVVLSVINSMETLEEETLPGTMIPLIPVIADDININGKRTVRGMVRNAKDPQRAYNYQVSAATEQVALAPKAPYIGAKGQFKSSETQWKSLNQRNFPYLEYDPIAVGGAAVGPPQRSVAEPAIQATVVLIKQADNDLKASLGLYDASLGQPGPEQSGKAILARQQQGNQVTYNYADNLSRSIRQLARVILEWIPVIYDVPRIQRIINPDKSVTHVGIYNSKTSGAEGQDYSPDDAMQELQGLDNADLIKEVYDIGVGRYDVVLSNGPDYKTMREESVASMMELIKVYPQLMEVAGDLLIGNMNWPYAEQISKRLKKVLPPTMLDDNDTSPEAQLQKMTAQFNQMQQQHQLLVQALQQANDALKTKRLELESKERIALFQADAQLVAAELKAHADGALENMKVIQAAITKRLELVHDSMTMEQEATLEQQNQPTVGAQPSTPGSNPGA